MKIYLVVYNHYMGMDGDYSCAVKAYSKLEYAEKKKEKLELRETHKNEQYDSVHYSIKEVELVY